MKNGRWQAKDIGDRLFLRHVQWCSMQGHPPLPWKQDESFYGSKGYDHFPHWVFRWNLECLLPMFPAEIILAKARALIRRGLLDGCDCGCRGDFVLTDAGRAFLAAASDPLDERLDQGPVVRVAPEPPV